jgi:glycosyltransferase involved in cell wall biosynthesis
MRVLLAHNYYRQPGGEDVVFANEAELLRRNGHTVIEYTERNSRIDGMNRVRVAAQTVWSSPARKRLLNLLGAERPDVIHFHNTFPLLSPSVYSACRELRVPVVQSLHNPRLLCPAATFYRNGQVCEDCLDRKIPWPSTLHGCYRSSRVQTAVVASMLAVHRWLNTWAKNVDAYVVFTEFYRRKFIDGGLPEDKLVVKPHFVFPDPVMKAPALGKHVVFIGRLQAEKGIHTLLRAWQKAPVIPLKLIGEGPLMNEVRSFIDSHGLQNNVDAGGYLRRDAVLAALKQSLVLVWPSEGHYETFGLVAVEAFACGVPVVASRAGAMAEMVEDGRTGLLFIPGDPDDLAAKIRWAVENPEAMTRMGENARRKYESRYTAEKNYEMLLAIYERVIGTTRN